MALARGLAGLRASVLSRLRLPAQIQSVGPPVALSLFRGFADSTYLDKGEVTERVLNVVKKYDKVDTSKVMHLSSHDPLYWRCSSASAPPVG